MTGIHMLARGGVLAQASRFAEGPSYLRSGKKSTNDEVPSTKHPVE